MTFGLSIISYLVIAITIFLNTVFKLFDVLLSEFLMMDNELFIVNQLSHFERLWLFYMSLFYLLK